MSQMVHSAIVAYCDALQPPPDAALDAVRRDGEARGLPIVHDDTGRLLRTLVAAMGARRILEIGTAVGYSTVWMAGAMPPDGLLLSIEMDAERAAAARAHLERAGLASRASVIVSDAARYLHKVAGPFDLIFQDGSKQLYEPLLDRLVSLLRPGGLLATDNALWGGQVVEGFEPDHVRSEADAAAIRAYNARLHDDPRLMTTIVPVGDGVALSVRRGEGGPSS